MDKNVDLVVSRLRRLAPVETLLPLPTRYVTQCAEPVASEEYINSIRSMGATVPSQVVSFWQQCGGAGVFVDETYGQWGLHLFSPAESAESTRVYLERRRRDVIAGDAALGEFYGDTDLLLIRCDSTQSDYGHIVVATGIDERSLWFRVAESFVSFMTNYIDRGGSKFWEILASDGTAL